MYIFITLVLMTVPRHQHLGAFIILALCSLSYIFSFNFYHSSLTQLWMNCVQGRVYKGAFSA